MRSSIVLRLACIGVVLACTPTGPEPSSEETLAAPGSLAPPTGAWVVIDEASGMFETNDANARRVVSRAGSWQRLRVAEVVAIEHGYVELRTIAGPAWRACAGDLGFERDYELRFFVEPDALHPVLARPKQVMFRDGTRLELAAGVPVIESGPEGKVRVGKTQLVVDLAEEDVGRWWIPSEEPTGNPMPTGWEPNLELHYGEHHFVGEGSPFLEPHEEQVPVPGGRLLTFENTCGRFVLRTDTEDTPEPSGPRGAQPVMSRNFDPDMAARQAGILGLMQQQNGGHPSWAYGSGPIDVGDDWGDAWAELAGCTPPIWTAAAGTKLSWPDGGDAGTVLVRHDLPRSAKEHGGRLCFVVDELDVCIESTRLEHTGDAECKPGSYSIPGHESKPAPQIRQAKAEVSEGLDRDIVRRIVRAHINEVRSCYAAALKDHPTLAGRVAIAFEIGPTGKVTTSEVHESSAEFADDTLAPCIAKAVERWTFPKPQGGATVSVVYPFVLSPD